MNKEYQLPDGGIYYGEIVAGKPNGLGYAKWKNGNIYRGSWSNGLQNGIGQLTRPSGKKESGTWFDGVFLAPVSETIPESMLGPLPPSSGYNNSRMSDGEGTYTWPNGDRYKGNWLNGKMHGVGTMHYSGGKEVHGVWYDGELIYEFVKAENTTHHQSYAPHRNHKRMTALLIGNNNYPDKPLKTCVSDAEAISKKLHSIGIDTTLVKNATKKEMVDSIKNLEIKSKYYDDVIFFYSGHGISNQGRHYISSIDENSDDSQMLSLEKIDSFLSECDYENIIIISDACCSILNTQGDAAPVTNKGKTLMALSTSMGNPSFDGKTNGHSPFAMGLLEYIDKPMEIVQMFREVNRLTTAVAQREIGVRQLPVLVVSPLFPTDLYLSC